MSTPKRTGNCFEAAAKRQFDAKFIDGCHWTLVHGLPLGTGGNAEGLRYPHAWLERDDIVWDPVADRVAPKFLYYAAGNIEFTVEYDGAEASAMQLSHEHYGPWADELIEADDYIDKLNEK
jgi:hypothetical protein